MGLGCGCGRHGHGHVCGRGRKPDRGFGRRDVQLVQFIRSDLLIYRPTGCSTL